MSTPSAKNAHQTRQLAGKITQKLARPHGNYNHAEFIWGYVQAVHDWAIDDLPPTVDLYPNGAQNTNNTDNLILRVKYMPWYVPTIGDVVLIYRGHGRVRSSKVVLGKLNGSASPYPTPLGGVDSGGRFNANLLNLWSAVDVPADALGAANDWCLSQNGHIYYNAAGSWMETI